jgi:non-heme Fe2+,alpha-ketoglutarate-dependent halogenase
VFINEIKTSPVRVFRRTLVSHSLSAEQVERYRKDGIVHPLPVVPKEEVSALLAQYSAVSGAMKGRYNQKPYLLHTWLDRLVRDPRILDAVESLHGPNLLCWGAQFFTKAPGDGTYVSWHQDATYWGLSSNDVVTAWIALTPSTEASGCVQVVPGTHHHQVAHEDRYDDSNLLSRGQEIAVKVDPEKVVNVVLQPGEMSLHHVLLFHGSNPNAAELPRIGFAVRYIPTHVKQLSPIRDSALLVRGEDTYGHFDLERSPVVDMDADAVACHADALDRQLRILYAGAQARGKLNPARAAAEA